MICKRANEKLGLLSVLLALAMAGCTDSATKEIKNSQLFPGAEFTFAEVLENKQGCEKTEWSSAENADGRAVVTVVCYRQMPADLPNQFVSERAANIADRAKVNQKVIADNFEEARRQFAEAATAVSADSLREAQRTAEALGPVVAQLTEEFRMQERAATRAGAQNVVAAHEQAAKLWAELAPMRDDLQKAEAVIERSKAFEGRAASYGTSLTSVLGAITPDDLKLYDEKKEAYAALVQSKTDELIGRVNAFGKDIVAEPYGVSISFVALKSSAPRISDAFYFAGSKDNKQPLGFLPQLLSNPSTFAAGMNDAGRMIVKKGVERIDNGARRVPHVWCFLGKEKFCDSN